MISVVIPIHNEEANLPELYNRVTRAAATWGDDYEVIPVDDGSTDTSRKYLEGLHRHDPRWKVLSFSRRFGHQTAISAGLFYSGGDVVAVMDGDLQDPPEELGRFLEKWREGYDVVYAIRTKRKEGLFKRVCYMLFYRVLHRLASLDMPLDAGDFCVMDRAVVDVLRAMPERNRFVRGLRCWSGFRQLGLPYERAARYAGTPKYTFSRLVRLAVTGILLFSSVPLRLAAWAGFCLCALSLLSVPVILVWALANVPIFGMHPRDAAGWTSLVSLICLMAGLQLLAMGVIGQYLARVFDEVQGRPPWVIAYAMGFGDRGAPGDPGWFSARRPVRQQALGDSTRSVRVATAREHNAGAV